MKDLTKLELKAVRNGFGEGLVSIGEKNPDVVALNADLESSLCMDKFALKFPDRFFETGIQEQNMTGVAAGMALDGKIPYMGSFACFSPGRNFDQIRISICMMNANVKIVSSHAGFSYGPDGITVQMLEDIAMMRVLPNMKIIVPADANQAHKAAEAMAEIEGPVYLRLGRSETPLLFDLDDPDTFQFGKAQTLRTGNDVTIVTTGYMTFRSLLAADIVSKQGINCNILNIHTIKPLDMASILESVSRTRAVVVAEEAQKYGGLCGAVCELLAQNFPTPVELVAVQDRFGESGEVEDLVKSRGLLETDIVTAIEKVIQRK